MNLGDTPECRWAVWTRNGWQRKTSPARPVAWFTGLLAVTVSSGSSSRSVTPA